jgi:16S rRNA (guanine966-N2)-methyltransferase
MRIISGKARSIRLQAPAGHGLRPTEDRVKEAIFASLGDLHGHCVVDLFAGTGALGLEALSRGARCVRFIEKSTAHCQYIRRNLQAVLKAMGNPPAVDVELLCADAARLPALLPQLAASCDLILADPPYHPAAGDYAARALLLDSAFADWAGAQALLVLEFAAELSLPWSPASAWKPIKIKSFGKRAVAFARLGIHEHTSGCETTAACARLDAEEENTNRAASK